MAFKVYTLCHLSIRVFHRTSLGSLLGDIVTMHDRYYIPAGSFDAPIGAFGGSSETRNEQGVLTDGF